MSVVTEPPTGAQFELRRGRQQLVVTEIGAGVRECMNAWLRLGGPHHQVLNPGRQSQAWRTFCELAGLEFAVA